VIRTAFALALAVGAASCAGTPAHVSLEEPRKWPRADDYVDELKRWTRYGHVRNDFDESLDVSATMRSAEFRAAYAEKWIDVYRVGRGDAERLRMELLNDGADTLEFHVETSAHNYSLNEFGAKSAWRVSVLDDRGREVTTHDVRPPKDKREVIAAFYPYASLFSRSWRFRFPRLLPDGSPLVTPETRSLTLRFAGPDGWTDLVWLLR
jgi:hypothetical protein